MTPAARISAAIEVLADIEARRRPATDALKDWGLSHRFAGSKDRRAIADRVYKVLRARGRLSWAMGGREDGRALVIGSLVLLAVAMMAAVRHRAYQLPPPKTKARARPAAL